MSNHRLCFGAALALGLAWAASTCVLSYKINVIEERLGISLEPRVLENSGSIWGASVTDDNDEIHLRKRATEGAYYLQGQ